MNKFNATIEYLSGQKAAIVTLTDLQGDWAGSSRVEVKYGGRGALYEEGYRVATVNAVLKGGRVETFRVDPGRPG